MNTDQDWKDEEAFDGTVILPSYATVGMDVITASIPAAVKISNATAYQLTSSDLLAQAQAQLEEKQAAGSSDYIDLALQHVIAAQDCLAKA